MPTPTGDLRFVNWAKTQSGTATEAFEPTSEEEVIQLVRRAHAEGRRIKVVGAGHSWSAIAVPDDWMVSLRRLDRVLAVDGDRVTVEAGIQLHALCEALDQRGLALPILGSIAEQSLAGALGTGTHGSSLRHGNLGSIVEAMRLITGTGEVVDLAGDEVDVARTHLGALGIVTRITFRAVPAFRLEEELQPTTWDAALADLDRLVRAEEYVKLWWLPHTERVAIFTYRRTEAPANASSLRRWVDERLVNRYAFAGLLSLGAAAPRLVPALNGVVAGTYFLPRRTVDRSDRVLTLAMPPLHREAEWAFPVARTTAGLRGLRSTIEQRRLVVDFVVEARFVRGDSGWMSPAFGGDVCQLGVYAKGGADAYFAAAGAMLRELGGRPHWGKEAELTPAEVLAMWPKAAEFRARMEVWDPKGIFRNPFLTRLFPR